MKLKKIMVLTLSAVLIMSLTACSKEAAIITSVAGLSNKNIGVQTGSTGEIYANDSIEGAKINGYKTYSLAIEDLNSGRIDAVICDKAPAEALVKENPEKIKILAEELSVEEYALAVRKGDTESLTAINNALATLKSNGTYDKLMKNYFSGEEIIITPPVITEPTAGQKVWRVGTSSGFKPYEFIDNNQLVGFDIELGAEIAKLNNWNYQPQDMGFDGLILSLQNENIDAIISGMSVTEERKKSVDFTDPYFKSSLVAIVAK